MALVAWKPELPTCAQSWSEQPQSTVIRTNVDVGPAKVRRRSALVNRTIEVGWTLPANLYVHFMEFYDSDCLQGINEFEYKHPVTGQMNRYRFAEPPRITFIGGDHSVAAIKVDCQWELQA